MSLQTIGIEPLKKPIKLSLFGVPLQYDLYFNGVKLERKKENHFGFDSYESPPVTNNSKQALFITLILDPSKSQTREMPTDIRTLFVMGSFENETYWFADFKQVPVETLNLTKNGTARIEIPNLPSSFTATTGGLKDRGRKTPLPTQRSGEVSYAILHLTKAETLEFRMIRLTTGDGTQERVAYIPVIEGKRIILNPDAFSTIDPNSIFSSFGVSSHESENTTFPFRQSTPALESGYLKLVVPRDTKITINGKPTTQEGEIRLFEIPLPAGESFRAKVKFDFRHPNSGRQTIREKTYVLIPGQTLSEEDISQIPETLK